MNTLPTPLDHLNQMGSKLKLILVKASNFISQNNFIYLAWFLLYYKMCIHCEVGIPSYKLPNFIANVFLDNFARANIPKFDLNFSQTTY